MERLTYKTNGKYANTTVEQAPPYAIDCNIDAAITKLAEYEDLEEQGKLLKLPCAVGDTLYVLTEDSLDGIEETKCQSIVLLSKAKLIVYAPCQHDDWGGAKWRFKITDFYKKVFLTREEAEAALKEL